MLKATKVRDNYASHIRSQHRQNILSNIRANLLKDIKYRYTANENMSMLILVY
jgi:hypothetical protein